MSAASHAGSDGPAINKPSRCSARAALANIVSGPRVSAAVAGSGAPHSLAGRPSARARTGAVLGSPVGDPGSVARRLNRSFFAGLAALMISALTDVFPEAQRAVDEHGTDEGRALLNDLRTMTTAAAVWRLRHTDIGSYVDVSTDEMWELPDVRHIFAETKLGRNTPKPPVLVVQAVHDRIISVDDVDRLVEAYAAAGIAVTYHRDRFCGHLLLHPLSTPMTLRWLRDRFTGRPPDENRTRTVWPTLFNPSTYLGMLRLGVITAKVVLGRPVDRRDHHASSAR